jgi:hypothetical protein
MKDDDMGGFMEVKVSLKSSQNPAVVKYHKTVKRSPLSHAIF